MANIAGLVGAELHKQELLTSLNLYNTVLDNHQASINTRVVAKTATAPMLLFQTHVKKHKENVVAMINTVEPMPAASIYTVLLFFRQRLMALMTDMATQQTE